jgi:hypothetical protein
VAKKGTAKARERVQSKVTLELNVLIYYMFIILYACCVSYLVLVSSQNRLVPYCQHVFII